MPHIRFGRDIREAAGQLVRGHIGERPGHRLGRVPTSGQDHIVELRLDLQKHVALGVAQIQQIRAGECRIFRLAFADDQLRRFGGDHDVWSRTFRHISVLRLADVHRRIDRCVHRDLVWHPNRDGPVPHEVPGGVPLIVAGIQVVGLGTRVEDDRERRVDHARQVRVLDRLHPRLAIDRHEHGGGRGEDYLRWCIVEVFGHCPFHLNQLQAGQ